VITLDRPADQIVVRHYRPDHTPAHEMRGRNGSSMFLGLIRQRLVSQLSHAGYLGAELAKADAALRLGLRYAQDRPLRSDAAEGVPPSDQPAKPRMAEALDAQHLALVPLGSAVQLVIQVDDVPEMGTLAGTLLEPAEPGSGPRSFRSSQVRVRVGWREATRVAMGGRDDLAAGALLRVQGELQESGLVMAEGIAVLTSVATVLKR